MQRTTQRELSMTRPWHVALATLLLCFVPLTAARAEMCVLDQVPAATVLVPYFEVDLNDPDGATTYLRLHNATATATLVNLTVWSDWGYPTLYFNAFLTGYDVVAFDMAELFYEGNIPITADLQSDTFDTISPHGGWRPDGPSPAPDHPEWDGSFDNCLNFFPYYINPLIYGGLLERVRDGLTGETLSDDRDPYCIGSPSPGLARGFVTIDVVDQCGTLNPADLGYYRESDPHIVTDNRLWGEFAYRDATEGTMALMPMVHIEADPSFDESSTATGATFYGRFSGGSDHREPLGTRWATHVYAGASDTDLLVWRGFAHQAVEYLQFGLCTPPDGLPIDQNEVLCWDEQENLTELCSGVDCFPRETQRVSAADDLSAAYGSGWCRLHLGSSTSDRPDQSWAGAIHHADGMYEAGLPSIVLSSACDGSR